MSKSDELYDADKKRADTVGFCDGMPKLLSAIRSVRIWLVTHQPMETRRLKRLQMVKL